jgi:Mce-associated membrane protein
VTKDIDSDDTATTPEALDATTAAEAVELETPESAEEGTTEEGTTEAADPPPDSADVGAERRRLPRLVLPIVLVVVLVASAAVTAWFYFARYTADQKVDQAVAASVLQSASDGAVALLSYSPDTLDKDFTNAKARLTGDFLNYYTQFTQQIVTPAAKQKQVKTSAAVVRSAISKLEPTSAEVLLFINQSTVSKENPDGSFTASSVKVEMTKVGNDWLISSFDPV